MTHDSTARGRPEAAFVSMTAATVAHCRALRPGKLALFGGGRVMDVHGDSPYAGLG